MANEINIFFCYIGQNLASKIPNSLLTADYSISPNLELFELQLQVFELLQKIPDTKTTGNNGIPVRFLKSNLTVIASLILHIINLSILSRKVPTSWKAATLTPLFKYGDRQTLLITGQYLFCP